MAAVGSHHDKIRFDFPGHALNLRRGVTNGRKLPAFRHTEDSPRSFSFCAACANACCSSVAICSEKSPAKPIAPKPP